GLGAARGAGHQIDNDAQRVERVTGGIAAVPAVQEVVTATPGEPVVTVAAEQPVGAGVATDDVVAKATLDILNAHQRVIAGLGAARGAGHQIDNDAQRVERVTGGIDAVPAVQEIVARTPQQRVIAASAQQDAGIPSAIEQALPDPAEKNTRARPANQRVVAAATVDDVVARIAINDIVAVSGQDGIAFRDWAGERTGFPREVAEAALAHLVGDEV